jgi:uncharacterized protein YbaA (DUF1428 family)
VTYVDGFVAAVPTANKDRFLQHARESVPLFKKLGATRQVECWGDDVPKGKVTDFHRAVRAKDDETVVFSWLEYPDRETRNAANEKMMNDPDAMAGMGDMPFDGSRMIVSGFAPILNQGSPGGTGYIDGFLIPVAAQKRADYLKVAEAAAPVFLDHGAKQVVETWGDDLIRGKTTDFYGAVNAMDDETVVFSWIAWPSREARETGNAASMADDRFKSGAAAGQPGSMDMPFDGKRMVMGGFVPILDSLKDSK